MTDKNIINFMDTTEFNFKSISNSQVALIQKIKDIDLAYNKIFRVIHKSGHVLMPFFLARTHSLYLAAARIGLGGQLPEGYPLLRGVLEQALYAWHVFGDPDIEEKWLNRMDSPDAKKLMKKSFQLGPILASFRAQHADIGVKISELYENFIDYGAHPNVFGVLGENEITYDEKEVSLNVQYIYGNGTFLSLFIKDLARAGLGGLLIYQKFLPKLFNDISLDDKLNELRSSL